MLVFLLTKYKKRQKIAKSDKLYYNENAKNKIIKHSKKYTLIVVRGVVEHEFF